MVYQKCKKRQKKVDPVIYIKIYKGMEQNQKIKTLIENVKAIELSKTNAKTAFLENLEVKKTLLKKHSEGIPVKVIWKSIVDSGFEVSYATVRKWFENNKNKK